MGRLRLILASASPRRLELLARIGVVPDTVIPAEIDETPHKGELPVSYACRMAAEKAAAVAEAGVLTLAADMATLRCHRRPGQHFMDINVPERMSPLGQGETLWRLIMVVYEP